MTRINAGIPPSELSDQHLLAEHREIKRIPNAVAKGKFKLAGQPLEFTLGTGHVKFFYTRLGYLQARYEQLYQECLNRNFKVTYYGSAWDGISSEYLGNWTPTPEAIQLIQARIASKQLFQPKKLAGRAVIEAEMKAKKLVEFQKIARRCELQLTSIKYYTDLEDLEFKNIFLLGTLKIDGEYDLFFNNDKHALFIYSFENQMIYLPNKTLERYPFLNSDYLFQMLEKYFLLPITCIYHENQTINYYTSSIHLSVSS